MKQPNVAVGRYNSLPPLSLPLSFQCTPPHTHPHIHGDADTADGVLNAPLADCNCGGSARGLWGALGFYLHQLCVTYRVMPVIGINVLDLPVNCGGCCRLRAAGRGESTVYRDKETGASITADEYAEQVRAMPAAVHRARGGAKMQRTAVRLFEQQGGPLTGRAHVAVCAASVCSLCIARARHVQEHSAPVLMVMGSHC
jgi:hypothetical protein